MQSGLVQSVKWGWLRPAQATAPWLIGLAFVAVEIRRVSEQIAVRYPDFFGWAEWAAAFDPRHPSEWLWADGLYPFGYPLLLRLGVELGLDVLQAGFALSIIGGFLGLMGTFWLVRRLSGNWTLAVFSQFTLGCMAFYLFFANLDSTDMPASGLLICSLALLAGEEPDRRVAFGAGMLAGLSYLIRYTASTSILLCALFLAGMAIARRQRAGLTLPVIYLLGAAIGAAPQLIASLIIKGNPFYNHQAHNLWFHLTGSSDYIHDWQAVPMDISLWEVISADPKLFFSHWWNVFRSSWYSGELLSVDAPFAPLMHAGFVFTVLYPGSLRRSARAFLAWYVVGFLALLSFVRLDRRFLIPLMPVQVFGCLYFLWSLLPAQVRVRRLSAPLRIPVLMFLIATTVHYPLRFMVSNPHDEQIIKVSNIVHAAGAETARDVFSTHVEFHDVSDPWKRRYDQAAAFASTLSTEQELLNFIRERGYRLFIFDRQTGLYLYPDLEWLLHPENRPAGLTPVYFNDQRDFTVYRVEREDRADLRPVSVRLENGIMLTGYERYLSEDAPAGSGRRVGLYLHWQAAAPIHQRFKVFVHVFDSEGRLATQHDSEPALWTYLTDRWKEGEKVVDFHPLLFEATQGRGPYTIHVGFYDPVTGQRVQVLDSSGIRMSDHVVLETFTFD